MKAKTLLMLAGAAAIGAFSYAEGLGPFNRLKFKNEHDAVSRYVEAHYPNAVYSPIVGTANGWTVSVRRFGMEPVILYITKSADGMYVFREETPSFSKQ